MSGTQNSRTRFQSPGGSGSAFAGSNVKENGVVKATGVSVFDFVGATVAPGGPGEAIITITPGGSAVSPEYHTVTALELAAKQFNLSSAPTIQFADVCDGAPLQNAVDYSIAGAIFSWNGLGLDGIIAEGDVIRINHN
jgi:hypothetical protein